MSRGHITSTVGQILRNWSGTATDITVRLSRDLPALRRQFWHYELDRLSAHIAREVLLAQQALARCSAIVDPEPLAAFLEPLAASAREAQLEKQRVLGFIDGYEDRPGAQAQ